jgi:DNA-directed RNA polymerase specialized sigma24 family protein
VHHDDRTRDFEFLPLQHLDAVYNVAVWLAGNAADAEGVVQEVYLRAFRYFEGYQGGNFRVWSLTILRNTFITWANTRRADRLCSTAPRPAAIRRTPRRLPGALYSAIRRCC